MFRFEFNASTQGGPIRRTPTTSAAHLIAETLFESGVAPDLQEPTRLSAASSVSIEPKRHSGIHATM